MTVVVSLTQYGIGQGQIFHVPEGHGSTQVIVDVQPPVVTITLTDDEQNRRIVKFDTASCPPLNVTISVIPQDFLDIYGLEGFEMIERRSVGWVSSPSRWWRSVGWVSSLYSRCSRSRASEADEWPKSDAA